MKAIPIFSGDGKRIGEVAEKVFTKVISSVQGHFLHKPPAIAFDVTALRDARHAGAKLICVRDRDTNREYWSTFQNMNEHGFKINRKHGVQKALTMNRWARTREKIEPKPIAHRPGLLF